MTRPDHDHQQPHGPDAQPDPQPVQEPGQQPGQVDIELPYNPRAEFGDPDWREPASDEEAHARTSWLDAQPRSEQDRAWHQRILDSVNEYDPLDEPTERLRLAQLDRGDPEDLAEATEEYRVALAAAQARDREQEARQEQARVRREQQRQRGDGEAEL